MKDQTDTKFPAERWFYLFAITHLLCWTLAPALVRYNLPLDAIEGTIWGHQLEWGYDKNPFLNGWLTALAVSLGSSSGWQIYLFSQLSVICCFWSIWQLGKQFLNPCYALIAVLLLEGIQYFNFHAIDFNDNTLELGLWGFTTYCFYRALRPTHAKTRWWILTGLFAGLGMMAKYYTATLLTAMGLLMLLSPIARKQLSTRAFYWGVLAFLLIILPHVTWLYFHDFVTIRYVFARASSFPSWKNHFTFPAIFAWQQFEVLAPAVILYLLLFIGPKPYLAPLEPAPTSFDKLFLCSMGLGPLLLTLMLSLLCGTNLRAGWGMPLLFLSGLLLVSFFPVRLSVIKLQRFIALIFTLMAVLVTGYVYSLLDTRSPSSANFPGNMIASSLTRLWHEQFHTRLAYVAGSRWVGGNVSFYSPDHPAVYIEWNPAHAPWIRLNDLKKQGGLFIWEISANEHLPDEIKQQFPTLQRFTVMTFTWLRDHHQLTPVQLGIAILPPYQDGSRGQAAG